MKVLKKMKVVKIEKMFLEYKYFNNLTEVVEKSVILYKK